MGFHVRETQQDGLYCTEVGVLWVRLDKDLVTLQQLLIVVKGLGNFYDYSFIKCSHLKFDTSTKSVVPWTNFTMSNL